MPDNNLLFEDCDNNFTVHLKSYEEKDGTFHKCFITKPDSVLIICHNEQRHILCLKVERDDGYNQWELPGGRVNNSAESYEEAARRELLEETGVLPSKFEIYQVLKLAPSITTEKVHVFTTEFQSSQYRIIVDHSEGIKEACFFDESEILSLIRSGDFSSSADVAAILLFLYSSYGY